MIELENVGFRYKNQGYGLHSINLSVKQGEVILLCGTSGCGKTTITRLINGLIPNFYEGDMEGSIKVDGIDVPSVTLYDLVGKVGSVFQNPRSQFFNVDTTSELAFGCENMNLPKEEILQRIDTVAQDLNLKYLLDRNIFMLSGGEKQKVACGSIATMNPNIILLDEPSSNLDIVAIKDLQNVIKVWKSQGKTIIIAEHRLFYLVDICSKVVFMESGKVERVVSGEEFKNMSRDTLYSMGLRTNNLSTLDIGNRQVPTVSRDCISVDNFIYSYKDGNKALYVPHVDIPVNSVTALIGHNGAGKSTFSKMLCGLIRERNSTITIGGQRLNYKKRIKLCYMVMQDVNHQLFTESVLDEIMLSQDHEDRAKAMEILSKLDLDSLHDSHPMSLSGGQKQRVAIGSAIASDSPVTVYDEPTSGLDYVHMVEISKNIDQMKSLGKTQIIVTHDPEFILSCCDYVIHMEKGKVKDCYPLNAIGLRKLLKYFSF